MKRVITILTITFCLGSLAFSQTTTRKERNFIKSGNAFYEDDRFNDALTQYDNALKENPASLVALFNKGLTQYQLAKTKDNADKKKESIDKAVATFSDVAAHASQRPDLAAKANYNLGNISYLNQDYAGALNYYKESLRLNPQNENARKNLRITQRKLQQNQDKNKNQDRDKEKKEDKKKENQQNKQQPKPDDKDKDKKDNQDKNQNNQEQRQQPSSPQNGMSKDAADRILKASENKEKNTRDKLMNASKNQYNRRKSGSEKNW